MRLNIILIDKKDLHLRYQELSIMFITKVMTKEEIREYNHLRSIVETR